ncbi:acetyl/propionyl/methylcrotonyl-CoA carboxylase subunit alpha [Comamonas sp. J-3]|jgi:acetyl-CoA/propionyl-CoA carboxylase biotin carboxyl carrier protein|uniref:acetyl/propionyl/methylcrotonyl-CoA carboxylase subunit alpha n=1 Tax=Comamonas trifloxystrobinivorans TaxID=3350256 RepID=UPI003729FFE8
MKKVLVANRSEIAVRIIRACADHGLQSVAVYADDDIDALHVRMADEAYALQGQRPAETYLNIDKLIAVAKQSGADAVHPGYGFLSENAGFARAVIGAGLTWIGPPPAAIEQLGDKVQARKLALSVGAPLVAGTPEPVKDVAEVHAFAREHGLPIAIKAAFGGGGRGLKVVWKAEDIDELYGAAVREAVTAFGRGECFVEQFLDKPRHIEAQVMADQHGHVRVLGTRDCSLQRRNQKLVEEAPAPFLTAEQRERIHQSARQICQAAGYVGAGTVEYLLSQSGAISFLEVNTRLQVEHPVTEETTGTDLVRLQFRVAEGEVLADESTPAPYGHAFEFRINAEDVGRGFLPAPGLVTRFEAPSGPGVRVDSGVQSGSLVAGQFDSMLAKLIVWGPTREVAAQRARRALKEFKIEGVPTVLPFHQAVMQHADFVNGEKMGVHTRWIETTLMPQWDAQPEARPQPAPDNSLQRVAIELDGRRVMLGLPAGLFSGLAVPASSTAATPQETVDANAVTAASAGTLTAWKVADGAEVAAGELIAVMEAMKMEMQLNAPRAGRIRLLAEAGSYQAAGAVIARME